MSELLVLGIGLLILGALFLDYLLCGDKIGLKGRSLARWKGPRAWYAGAASCTTRG